MRPPHLRKEIIVKQQNQQFFHTVLLFLARGGRGYKIRIATSVGDAN